MPLDMEPDMEEDTLDVPPHVMRFENVLMRNNDGFEPINNWSAADVAIALAALHRELVERDAMHLLPAAEGDTDDGQ